MASIGSYCRFTCGKEEGLSDSFLHGSFMDKPIGDVLKLVFYQKKSSTITELGCEAIKESALAALTVAARVPYYHMCLSLFPSAPGLGAATGVIGAIVPWGTMINLSFHDLLDEWNMKARLASPERRTNYCAVVAKATVAVVWSLLAESYSFAIIYLTTRRVDLVALSAISMAIPAHSCNNSLNWAMDRLWSSPERQKHLKTQELMRRKLRCFVESLSTKGDTELDEIVERFKDVKRSVDGKESALRGALKKVFETTTDRSTTKDSCAYKAVDGVATTLGVVLANVYLAWVGFLTYAGWQEILVPEENSEEVNGVSAFFATLAVLANFYVMMVGIISLCRAVPRYIESSYHGTRAIPLTERHYPTLTTIAKVVAVVIALWAFGPSTVVSLQYLPLGLAIASAITMSSASVLSPIKPMTTVVDRLVARLGRNAKDPRTQDLFVVLKQLQTLDLCLASASPSTSAALEDFLKEADEVAPRSSEKNIFSPDGSSLV